MIVLDVIDQVWHRTHNEIYKHIEGPIQSQINQQVERKPQLRIINRIKIAMISSLNEVKTRIISDRV
jgi:hypothetical protein